MPERAGDGGLGMTERGGERGGGGLSEREVTHSSTNELPCSTLLKVRGSGNEGLQSCVNNKRVKYISTDAGVVTKYIVTAFWMTKRTDHNFLVWQINQTLSR